MDNPSFSFLVLRWLKSVSHPRTELIPTIQLFTTGILLGALLFGSYGWGWLIPFAVYFCTGCLGITMTFHRYHSHHSFKLWKPLEYLFSFVGCLGGTGDPIGWVSVHQRHHRYADTELDPHSPIHGKWTVLLGAYSHDFNKWSVRELVNQRFYRFLHDYYFLILFVWGILLALISFDWLVLGFLIPVCIQIWMSNLSNYFNHLPGLGYRHFETSDQSRNLPWYLWPLVVLTFSEAWHNLHHKYPWSARFGLTWWEFDITYWMICLLGREPRHL